MLSLSPLRLWHRYSHLNWALTDQVMVSGANFFTSILLARTLGLMEFGVYSLAWIAIFFLSGLQMAMVIAPMMSIGPKQAEEKQSAYYGSVLVQQIAFSLFSFVVLYTGTKASGIYFPQWQVAHLALPLASVTVVIQVQDFMRRYFFTRAQAPSAIINDAVRYFGQLTLLIWFSQVLTLDIEKALWLIAAATTTAIVIGSFRLQLLTVDWTTVISVIRRHGRFAKWLTAAHLMKLASGDFIMVASGAILGASSVGILRAAQNMMGFTQILLQGLENIVPIRSSKLLHTEGTKSLVSYLAKVATYGGILMAIIGIVIFIWAEFWLNLFYGIEFQPYGNIVRWYVVIYLITFMGLPLRSGLRALEHTRPIFMAYTLMGIFGLAAAYPLIEWLGLPGVMLGFLITQLISQIVLASTLSSRLKKAR